MDYFLRDLNVKREPRRVDRAEGIRRELNAAQQLFNRHPCRSYYRAVDRYTRMLARYNRLGYIRNWEKKS